MKKKIGKVLASILIAAQVFNSSYAAQLVSAEEPIIEEPTLEEPQEEEPKVKEAQKEEPKTEEVKTEEPKVEEPKTEEPKAEVPEEEKKDEVKVEDPSLTDTLKATVENNTELTTEKKTKVVKTYEEVHDASLTAEFVDEDGEAIADDIEITFDDSADVKDFVLDIEGYTFTEAVYEGEVVTSFEKLNGVAETLSEEEVEVEDDSEEDEEQEAPTYTYFQINLSDGNTLEITDDATVTFKYTADEVEEELVLVEKELEKTVGSHMISAKGNMPENAELKVSKIYSLSSIEDTLEEKVDSLEEGSFEAVVAFDISIEVDGEPWQPVDFDEKVIISISDVSVEDAEEVQVFRISDDESEVTEMDASISDDGVEFDTEHFTVYAVTIIRRDDNAPADAEGNIRIIDTTVSMITEEDYHQLPSTNNLDIIDNDFNNNDARYVYHRYREEITPLYNKEENNFKFTVRIEKPKYKYLHAFRDYEISFNKFGYLEDAGDGKLYISSLDNNDVTDNSIVVGDYDIFGNTIVLHFTDSDTFLDNAVFTTDITFTTSLDLNSDDSGKIICFNTNPLYPNTGYAFYVQIDTEELRGYYCTVSFDTDGGSDIEPITNAVIGSTIKKPEDPTKKGYNFKGWYSDANFHHEWDFDTDTVTEDTTLYALWKQKSFTVTFDSQGGSSVSSLEDVGYGTTIIKPSDPTKEGYVFAGWYSESELENCWNFDTNTVTEDTTLYASWKQLPTCTVTFASNGGSEVPSQTVISGEKIVKPTDPTKNGYVFVTWRYEADDDSGLMKAWDFDNDTVTSNMILYAGWKKIYTVSFNTNGGSSIANQDIVSGNKVTQPTNPTKDGYTFAGWYSDEELITEWNFGNDTVTSNMTLYAKWTVNSYNFYADVDGATFLGDLVQNQTVTYGNTATKPDVMPAKPGYIFKEWRYVEDDGTLGEVFYWNYTIVKNTKVKMIWEPAEILVNYTDPDAVADTDDIYKTGWVYPDLTNSPTEYTLTYGEALQTPDKTPTKVGYTFDGWYKDIDCTIPVDFSDAYMTYYTEDNGYLYYEAITEDVTGGDAHYQAMCVLFAKFTKNQYSVTYKDTDGTVLKTVDNVDFGATVTDYIPEKTGYTFDDWYLDEDLTSSWDGKISEEHNYIVYAKWNQKSYTVSFNLVNTDDVTGYINNQTVFYGNYAAAPDTSEVFWTGHHIEGWYTEPEYLYKWTFDADKVTKHTTLYAKWTLDTHTVTFDAQGGTPAPEAQTVTYGGKATEPTAPSKDGYTFKGWSRYPSTYVAFDFANNTVLADTTLTAFYDEVVHVYHTVTFKEKGGDTFSTVDVLDGKTVARPATDPTKEGYTFVGWFKNTALTQEWDFTTPITSNKTIYAKFTANATYTVSFNTNGGSSIASQTIVDGGKATEPASEPTKTGYTFGGYYKDSSFTNNFNFNTEVIHENTTIYVKWVAIPYTVTFNSNGGSTVASQTVNYNEKTTQPANPTKEGYTFAGWYSDSSLTTEWNFDTDVITGTTTLYAKWNLNGVVSYTVTFNSNGGSAVASQTVTDGNKVVKPANPTKDGYTFSGWYKDAALTTEFNFNSPITANTTIYAKWVKNSSTKAEEPKTDDTKKDDNNEDTKEEVKEEEPASTPKPIPTVTPSDDSSDDSDDTPETDNTDTKKPTITVIDDYYDNNGDLVDEVVRETREAEPGETYAYEPIQLDTEENTTFRVTMNLDYLGNGLSNKKLTVNSSTIYNYLGASGGTTKADYVPLGQTQSGVVGQDDVIIIFFYQTSGLNIPDNLVSKADPRKDLEDLYKNLKTLDAKAEDDTDSESI